MGAHLTLKKKSSCFDMVLYDVILKAIWCHPVVVDKLQKGKKNLTDKYFSLDILPIIREPCYFEIQPDSDQSVFDSHSSLVR